MLGVLVTAGAARASPDDVVGRPLVLAPGQLEAELVVDVDLAPGETAHPLVVSPDLWYGVAPRWTVGVVHSNRSVDRIEPEYGASLCVVTEDIGCNRLYHGSGVDVRWGALEWLAPRARFLLRDVSPAKPAVTVGALVQWTRGRFAVWGDPYLELGLANTDAGNNPALFLPIGFVVQPTCRWAIELRTGWNSDLTHKLWRDGYYVPVAVDVRARATLHLDVSVGIGFQDLLGPLATAKERELTLLVGWRS